jgi:hypothetical protein
MLRVLKVFVFLSLYNKVDKCDLVLLCQEYFRTDVPVAEDILAIKNLLKTFYGSGTGGEKVITS